MMLETSRKISYIVAPVLILLFGVGSVAQEKAERVKFIKGTSSATVKGTVSGYGFKDYLVKASAGQTMSLKLKTNKSYNYFVVFPPEEGADPLVNEVSEWEGKLPT